MKRIIKLAMIFPFVFLLFPVTTIAGEIIEAECSRGSKTTFFLLDSDGGKTNFKGREFDFIITKDQAIISLGIDNESVQLVVDFKNGNLIMDGDKVADCKFSNLEALKKKNTEDIVTDAIEEKIVQLDEMRAQRDEMRAQRDEMRAQRDEMSAQLNNYLLQNSSTLKNKEGSGMPIDCSWKYMLNTLMADYYFSYVNSDYEFKPDGKYQITIYSNYINGNFRINEMVSIPYIKSKSTFAPEYDGHWSTRDLRESELEILQKKDGFSDCKIKTIVYKGE